MAEAAKEKADSLFRDKKYTDAAAAYGEAIALDDANHKLYSNRAACYEALAKDQWGDEKRALVAKGLADGERCVALAPEFVRGHVRVATFASLARQDALDNVYDFDDYVEGYEHADAGDDDDLPRRGGSAKAAAAAAGAAARLERACRAGLALDRASAPLRELLQALRDDAGRAMLAGLAPTDAELRDAAGAAAHKARGNAHFGAKEFERAADAFTAALSCDPCDHVLYSNRSACRAGAHKYARALRDADACVALAPDWPKGHGRRATALFGLGRYVDAEAAADDGLRADEAAMCPSRPPPRLLSAL